ncbi:hypothetical protein QCA50_019281 [Cerrena zonata]|uniref:Uncharacterized protein n=1 Tax=Cerrena zonata TaxID=2478898 RepID=A0AAW0FE87_9APHY
MSAADAENPLELLLTFDRHATIGASFIGFAASSVLLGVICSQTWTYVNRYPLDTWFYKCLVTILLIMSIADQSFIGHAVYTYAITDWGNPLALLKPPLWTIILQVTVGSVVGFLVKGCFAMRVYRFSQHNKPVTAAICTPVRAFESSALIDVAKLKVVGIIALALGVATDIATAGALCFFLRNLKTGYSNADTDPSIIVETTP